MKFDLLIYVLLYYLYYTMYLCTILFYAYVERLAKIVTKRVSRDEDGD